MVSLSWMKQVLVLGPLLTQVLPAWLADVKLMYSRMSDLTSSVM